MELLDGQHWETSTYALVKCTPWSTSSEKTFGMRSRPKVRKAWSSERRITTFGRSAGGEVVAVGAGRIGAVGGDDLGAGFDPVQLVATRTSRGAAKRGWRRIGRSLRD